MSFVEEEKESDTADILEIWRERQQQKLLNCEIQGVSKSFRTDFNQSCNLEGLDRAPHRHLTSQALAIMGLLVDQLHYMTEEVIEALREVPFRRKYKNDHNRLMTSEEVANFKKELIDIGCFWMNCWVLMGVETEEIHSLMLQVTSANLTRKDHVGTGNE